MHDIDKIENHLTSQPYTLINEHQYDRMHKVYTGAPSEWAAERGATHTLWLGNGIRRGSRPAILKKTVLWVGRDELDDQIVWEKWDIKTIQSQPQHNTMITNYKAIATNAIRNLGLALEQAQDDDWLKKDIERVTQSWVDTHEALEVLENQENR
jgi:hypothetical protein